MADGDGIKPEESAEKSLGEIVSDVSDKATLLVREEIELAKTELILKAKRLGAAGAAAAAAGVFLIFGLSVLLHALSWFLVDVFSFEGIWPGFLIVFGLLVLIAAIAGFLAYRFVQKGTPPTPELAIEEAKETRKAIEEVRG